MTNQKSHVRKMLASLSQILIGGGIVLIISALPIFCKAQNLEVKGFQLSPTDISASAGSTGARQSVDDGKLAALIKVRVNVEGFQFDGGEFGLAADPDYTHPGEIWVYVRPGAKKLTIRHKRFEPITYYFNAPIESARTYILYLDPGVGSYYNIVTDGPCGTIYLDGDSIGSAPIYNEYITYGTHTLKAVTDQWEGVLTVDLQKANDTDITRKAVYSGYSEPLSQILSVKMVDQSEFFGPVNITTDPDAQIYFDGEQKGFGRWSTDLREGTYSAYAKKTDCDDSKIQFTVLPKVQNEVLIPSPIRHTGFVQIYTRPLEINITANGNPVDHNAIIELPVGLNILKFSRKGYDTQTKELSVTHNVTLLDTINLKRTQYLKSNVFYLGAAYTVGEFSGMTGTIGMIYRNVDAQISYTFGLDKKGLVNYYDPTDFTFKSQTQYTQNTFGVKLGFQFILGTNIAFTPQIGFTNKSLIGNNTEGSEMPGDGASCSCATIGGKLVYAPMKQLCIYGAPEYDIAVNQSTLYEKISKEANFHANVFLCSLGVIFLF